MLTPQAKMMNYCVPTATQASTPPANSAGTTTTDWSTLATATQCPPSPPPPMPDPASHQQQYQMPLPLSQVGLAPYNTAPPNNPEGTVYTTPGSTGSPTLPHIMHKTPPSARTRRS